MNKMFLTLSLMFAVPLSAIEHKQEQQTQNTEEQLAHYKNGLIASLAAVAVSGGMLTYNYVSPIKPELPTAAKIKFEGSSLRKFCRSPKIWAPLLLINLGYASYCAYKIKCLREKNKNLTKQYREFYE